MRYVFVIALGLLLAACEGLPQIPGLSKQGAPDDTTKSAGDAALITGFEYLNNKNYPRAEANFNRAIEDLPQFDAGQIHARIGKVLVYTIPQSEFRDLDRAENTLNEINILTKRVEMKNTVWEQTLILSVTQLVDAEVKARDASKKVVYKQQDTKALEAEIAQLKEEKAQADKTIAKLRSLTLQR